MSILYPSVIIKDTDGFTVIFPDLNHTTTCGDTLEEALRNAEDCLNSYVLSEFLEGNDVPIPTREVNEDFIKKTCEWLELQYDSTAMFTSIIKANLEKFKNDNSKTIKKSLTIPEWLNIICNKKKINYSEVLTHALEKELNL